MSSELPENDDAATVDTDEEFIDDGVLYDDEVTPEYGILGLTLRELLIVGAWLVLFILSFIPAGVPSTLWSQGITWVLPVGVPTVAVFLIVLRRFSPDGIRRVGSLGIDQFASVAFSVAAVWWAQLLWSNIVAVVSMGSGALFWGFWVQFAFALVLVALTVFAPIIPGIKEDFQGRLVTLAHRAANPVRPVIARPRPERVAVAAAAPVAAPVPVEAPDDSEAPVANATDEIARDDLASQIPLSAHASGGGTGTEQTLPDEDYSPSYSRSSSGVEIAYDTDSIVELVTPDTDAVDPIVVDEPAVAEPVTTFIPATAPADDHDVEATNPRGVAAEAQPFWILAATERDVHDEQGQVLFRIGPSAWALVIEDRGGAFVVRHDDGRIGYLHDISDVTRG